MSDITRSEAIDAIELIMRKYEEDERICCDITLGDEDYEALRLARDSLKVDEAYQLEYESTTKNDCETCIHNKGVLECDMYGCKYEPTTKNDLALIHTEGLDEEIRCTMCTNSMKSDRGCVGSCVVNNDMYKAVMDAIEKRIQPTTKNDLEVDTDKLIADCEKMSFDFELFGRPMKALLLDAVKNIVKDLPSVTSIRPKGHWITETTKHNRHLGSRNGYCSVCKDFYTDDWDIMNYCPNCGADMREVEEREDKE